MWLEGLEPGFNRGGNVDSHERYIYIHGTADQASIGRPASHGCIHLADADLIPLFDLLPAARWCGLLKSDPQITNQLQLIEIRYLPVQNDCACKQKDLTACSSALGKFFVVVALVSTLGAHWALLQTVAWTTMLANNLRTQSAFRSRSRHV